MDVLLTHGFSVLGEHVSFAEFVGQICALAVVFLAQRRTLWTWPVQVCATVLLFIVYTAAHLDGLAARQVVIFAISIYGWWSWVRHRDPIFGVRVRRATARERLLVVAVLALGTTGMALLLTVLHASWAPWPDAWMFVGTVLAFAAQGRGLVEFWLIWLLVDMVGVPLQLRSGLWFSAMVYVVFAALVIQGWWAWKRTAASSGTEVKGRLDADGKHGGQGEAQRDATPVNGEPDTAIEPGAGQQARDDGAQESDDGRRTGMAVSADGHHDGEDRGLTGHSGELAAQ